MFQRVSASTPLVAVLLVTVSLVAARPAHARCSNASLQGNYGILVTGTALGNPIAVVGQISADGSGSFTGMETISNNGVITNSAAVNGTYKIAAKCTGTAAITPEGGSTANYNLIIAGGKIQILGADAGTVESGFALPQGTDTCSYSLVKGKYDLVENGSLPGQGPIVYGGQITLSGQGIITGSRSGSTNGEISSGDVVTGAYKIDSRCFGGAEIFINHGSPNGFNLVVVNNGHGVLFIQTNDNTVLSGSLER